jgi:hypothetical protein
MAGDLKQVHLLMEPKDVKKLDRIAETHGLSRSALVRMWVKEKMTEG